MKTINKFINRADKVLKDKHTKIVDTNLVILDNAFDGHIAGFGPTVIMSGLIPTISTYLSSRKKTIEAIVKVAQLENMNNAQSVLSYCIENHNNKQVLNHIKEQLINASIALKLIIRTYNLNLEENEN